MQRETIYITQRPRPEPAEPLPLWLTVPFGTLALFGFIAFMLGGVSVLGFIVGN